MEKETRSSYKRLETVTVKWVLLKSWHLAFPRSRANEG